MLEIIILAAAVAIFRRQLVALGGTSPTKRAGLIPPKHLPQVAQLAEFADRLYNEKKWLAAEKAYLNVLKADHKNVTAYSHLGVIYTTQKNLADAIECFEIAARIRPSGGTCQNLGLAYFENRNYTKSIAAFEKAILFEPTAQRYIGLAKAYKKIGNETQMTITFEHAAALEPSKKVLQLLAEAYEATGRKADATEIYNRIRQSDQAAPTSA